MKNQTNQPQETHGITTNTINNNDNTQTNTKESPKERTIKAG